MIARGVRKVSAGSWPQVGRVIGLLVVLVVLSITLFSLPDRVADLRSICEGEVCAPGQLTPATAIALQNNGISTQAYAAWTASLDIAAVTAYLIMAWLLLWRKGTERMGLIVGLFFNGLALDTFPLPTLSSMGAPWIEMEAINWSLSIGIGVVLFAATFPSGHLVPRWARWFILFALLEEASRLFVPGSPINPDRWPEDVQGLELIGWVVLVVIWMIHRYRRVSTLTERQQTKWVLLAFSATLVANIAAIVVTLGAPEGSGDRALLMVVTASIVDLSLLLTPLAISVAILRYQLFEIDRLIKRTLAYGLLTTLLAGLYLALVALLDIAASGPNSSLVVAASTLTVAAVFQPLRERIQTAVDRRFDRTRYDAIRTTEEFSSRVGNQTDLTTLLGRSTTVVAETMRPSLVAIWTREPTAARSFERSN